MNTLYNLISSNLTKQSVLPSQFSTTLSMYPSYSAISSLLRRLVENTQEPFRTLECTVKLMEKIAAFYQFSENNWRRCLIGCFMVGVQNTTGDDVLDQINELTGISIEMLDSLGNDILALLEIQTDGEEDSFC